MADIYLDNAATTRPHPSVAEAVMRTLTEVYGNPSSLHGRGVDAERLVTGAREAVAASLGVSAAEIIFTSGGTEANNLALGGAARRAPHRPGQNPTRGRHVVITAIEHSSVLSPARALAAEGFAVTELSVDAEGRVSAEQVAAALRPETAVVSVMAVNNEIGSIQPLDDLARVVRAHRAGGATTLLHVDAVQAWGKIPLRPARSGIDLLSISGHKVHGPKGVGALYIRRGVRLAPLVRGGDQEQALRPGTENVPGIAGMGEAARLVAADGDAAAQMAGLIRRLRERLARIPDVIINTPETGAAPHILNVSFPGARGETLLHRLEMDGIYVSTGSACHSHQPTPSHVLLAIGRSPDEAVSSLRFSVGHFTTTDDIDAAASAVEAAAAELRALAR
ncbi:MAG TPA: cysteine desulfurase family protein [bacterium]|nr:cysteine desulfurase family protein [bacterium]